MKHLPPYAINLPALRKIPHHYGALGSSKSTALLPAPQQSLPAISPRSPEPLMNKIVDSHNRPFNMSPTRLVTHARSNKERTSSINRLTQNRRSCTKLSTWNGKDDSFTASFSLSGMYRNHSIYAATNENSRRLAKSIRFEKLQLSKEKEEADYIRRIGLVADLEKQHNLPLP